MASQNEESVWLPCVVCGFKAEGFHYGADTCAPCKIFFRRNINRSPKHKCIGAFEKESDVVYLETNRIHECPKCRLQQCLKVGMSLKGSKKGRYTLIKKHEYIKKSRSLHSQAVLGIGEQRHDSEVPLNLKQLPVHPIDMPLDYTNKSLKEIENSEEKHSEDQTPPDTPPTSVADSNEVVQSDRRLIVPSRQKVDLPVTPSTVEMAIGNLSATLSHIFQMSGTFPPDFFEKLPHRQQKFMEYKDLSQNIIGSERTLSMDEYSWIYKNTSIDIDGRLSTLHNRITGYNSRISSYYNFMHNVPGFQNISAIDGDSLKCTSRHQFVPLSEYRCYDPSNGLHTTADGVTQDTAEMKCLLPSNYVDHLFKWVSSIQSLKLTEFEDHLIKCIVLFNPDQCLTVQGGQEAERLRQFYIKILDYVIRASDKTTLPEIFSVMDDLNKMTNENCVCLRDYLLKIKDLLTSKVNPFAKYFASIANGYDTDSMT